MQTDHKTLKVEDVATDGLYLELYDYGDGDVLFELHPAKIGSVLLSPADVIQVAAFCRAAFERGKTNAD